MTGAPESTALDTARPVPLRVWRTARLSLDYLLDTIQLSRGSGDILDPLLVAAIVEANVRPVRDDPVLQLEYAALNAPVPDELRRPVSVSGIAHSLGLPFETVRRRIGQMSRAGVCIIGPKGVVVPTAVLMAPWFQQAAQARYERMQRFYYDLRAMDALPQIDPAQANAEALGNVAPVRAANRLMSEYVMRFIDNVMRRLSDPLTGLILLDLTRANTEHLSIAQQEAQIPIPDRLRQPVSVARIAKRLNASAETVRRRILWLEEQGFCLRTPKGMIVPAQGVMRPGVISLMGDNAADVQRLFTKLNRLGMLAIWDREAPDPRKKAETAA